MATYLPIRAFNRSQAVRIGQQMVKSITSTGALAPVTYIDLEDKVARKELGYHSAIGAVYTCGPVTSSNYNYVVVSGLTVTQGGTSPTNKNQVIAAGVVKNRNNGANISVNTATLTLALAASTKNRIDLLIYDTSDSTLKVVAGTETTGTAVAPTATVTSQVPVATVAVSDSAISAFVDVRVLTTAV